MSPPAPQSMLALLAAIGLLLVPAAAVTSPTAKTFDEGAREASTPSFDDAVSSDPGFERTLAPTLLDPWEDEDCTPHPPIRASQEEGLDGFILGHHPETGEPIYRPGSGVVAGNGTAEDPYVIGGWCIRSGPTNPLGWTGDQAPGILLEDTEAHVVVRDNLVVGANERTDDVKFSDEFGIQVDGALNVSLVANTVEKTDIGLFLTEAPGISVEDNSVAGGAAGLSGKGDNMIGVYLWESEAALLENNTVQDFRKSGVEAYFSDGLRAQDNTLQNNTLVTFHGSGHVVKNNTATGSALGLYILDTVDAVIEENTIVDSAGGLKLASNSGTVIRDNTLVRTGAYGVHFYDWGIPNGNLPNENITIEHNEIADSETGIVALDGVPGMTLRGNNIHNHTSGVGLDATDAFDEIDARENWWGCPDGPDDAACDDAVGNVTYDPWLTSPS